MQVFLLLFLINLSTGQELLSSVPMPSMEVCETTRAEAVIARPKIPGVNYGAYCVTTRSTTEEGS